MDYPEHNLLWKSDLSRLNQQLNNNFYCQNNLEAGSHLGYTYKWLSSGNNFNWPSDARFMKLDLLSSPFSYLLDKYITYSIAFMVVVYCYFGYLPVSLYLISICSIFLAYVSYALNLLLKYLGLQCFNCFQFKILCWVYPLPYLLYALHFYVWA